MALINPQYGTPIGTARTSQGEQLDVIATRAFWDYIATQLYARVGGASAPTNNDLAVDLPEDAGIEELKHEFFKFCDETRSAPIAQLAQQNEFLETQIASLMATIAALRERVDGLEQRVS